jgi:surface polysaccharide O-acyltransferase-like enzyme
MNKRNHFLDFWKFIAAIGVILVHIQFPGTIGKILALSGSEGVCLFALISGYACFGDSKETSEKIIKRLKRNGLITLISIAVYVIFSYFLMKSLGQYALWKNGFTDPNSYIRMLALGDFEFFYASHLWFMVALVYSYIIFYFLVRYNLKTVIHILLFITIGLSIAVGILMKITGASWHVRNNFLIGVLPLMLIGYVIAEQKEKILKISTAALITCSAASAIAVLAAICTDITVFDILHPLSVLFWIFIMMIGIKKPDWHIIKPFAYMGQNDTLYIYLFHVIVILIMRSIINSMPLSDDMIILLLPIVSVIGSVLLARLISVITTAVKNKTEHSA